MSNIKTDVERAIREASSEQPWDGYYMVRGSEIENLLRFLKLNKLARVLDVVAEMVLFLF